MGIDFVIPWVDGNDEEWIKQRNSYSGYYTESRYREWNVFKYWFRSVEKYAPWVDKIHLITCGQVPTWLNTEHPKLKLVFHKDYIPERFLPTFSANPIELNLHRIEGLSETFVYFNDDMFLCSSCKEGDFFKNGLPCDSAILNQFAPSAIGHQFSYILCNDIAFTNHYFNKKAVMKKNLSKWFNLRYGKRVLFNVYSFFGGGFSSFYVFHIPQAFRKSDFEEIWKMNPELLEQTSSHKFREASDINQYAVRYLNLCKGDFSPRNPKKMGSYCEISKDDDLIAKHFRNQSVKMICVNDIDSEGMDFEKEYKFLHELLEEVFPEKSSFEI